MQFRGGKAKWKCQLLLFDSRFDLRTCTPNALIKRWHWGKMDMNGFIRGQDSSPLTVEEIIIVRDPAL